MRAAAIVPVKRFAAAKQRLSATVADGPRAALAEAMLLDVLDAVGRCEAVERLIVVSGEPAAARAAAAAGVECLDDPDDRSHSHAASIGVTAALGGGAECVALLPGDCPLLDPGELAGALGALTPESVGVIPDRHWTGTNGLLLSPPDAIEPAFGPGSHERHLELARQAGRIGLTLDVASLALDLDTADDLQALRVRLEQDPSPAPHTAAVLAGRGAGAEL